MSEHLDFSLGRLVSVVAVVGASAALALPFCLIVAACVSGVMSW